MFRCPGASKECAVNLTAPGLGFCQVRIMEGGGEKGARKMRVKARSDHNDGPLHLPREIKTGRTTGS